LQITASRNPESKIFELAFGHEARSKIFKPEVSVIINRAVQKNLISEQEERKIFKKIHSTGENQYMQIHLVSDGNKAYIKLV